MMVATKGTFNYVFTCMMDSGTMLHLEDRVIPLREKNIRIFILIYVSGITDYRDLFGNLFNRV